MIMVHRFNVTFLPDFANFGSDIGGYRSGSGSLGRTKELFIRWAQLGAFSPLMENGGNMEHRPWKFDTTNQTLDIYRKWGIASVFSIIVLANPVSCVVVIYTIR